METREASRARQGARTTMAGPETQAAMVGQVSPWPWPLARPLWP